MRATVARVLLLLLLVTSGAKAAPASGEWRLHAAQQMSLFVESRPGDLVTLHSPGRFFAIGFWLDEEFTGLVRQPDWPAADSTPTSARIKLVLGAQLDSLRFATSTRRGVDPRSADATIWEWVRPGRAPAQVGSTPTTWAATPRTTGGIWRSRAHFRQTLEITRGLHGECTLFAPGAFIATGFVKGADFQGLIRAANGHPATHDPGTQRMLARLTSDTTLALSVGAEPDPSSPETEIWEYSRADAAEVEARARLEDLDRHGASALGPDRAPGPLPKFGDYVYVEVLPEAVVRVAPVYPDEARKANVDGTVMIQLLVREDGTVADSRVVKSIPLLDDAATAAARQWRFKPAMSRGEPVAVWVSVPIKFSLH